MISTKFRSIVQCWHSIRGRVFVHLPLLLHDRQIRVIPQGCKSRQNQRFYVCLIRPSFIATLALEIEIDNVGIITRARWTPGTYQSQVQRTQHKGCWRWRGLAEGQRGGPVPVRQDAGCPLVREIVYLWGKSWWGRRAPKIHYGQEIPLGHIMTLATILLLVTILKCMSGVEEGAVFKMKFKIQVHGYRNLGNTMC